MGNKVHPRAFRLAVTHGWDEVWFSSKQFPRFLREGVSIRAYLKNQLKEALVDRIELQRARQDLNVNITAAKPGVIIGRAGAGIEELVKKIKVEFFRGQKMNINVNVKEIQQPALCARVVASQIVTEIEKRLPFRRSMKMAIERSMKAGALGVKVRLSGRLNGAEIARTEKIATGKLPLHTLRADIDFANVQANTIWGAIGVKVWINRGEVFKEE